MNTSQKIPEEVQKIKGTRLADGTDVHSKYKEKEKNHKKTEIIEVRTTFGGLQEIR